MLLEVVPHFSIKLLRYLIYMHATCKHACMCVMYVRDVCACMCAFSGKRKQNTNSLYRTYLALSDMSCRLLSSLPDISNFVGHIMRVFSFVSDTSSCGHIWMCRTYLAGTGPPLIRTPALSLDLLAQIFPANSGCDSIACDVASIARVGDTLKLWGAQRTCVPADNLHSQCSMWLFTA